MLRREFLLAIGLAAVIRPGRAQAPGAIRMYRVGLLEAVPAAQNSENLEALRQGLEELGYVEGRNLIIEYRSSDGQPARLPQLAAELVSSKMDVIVARGTPA